MRHSAWSWLHVQRQGNRCEVRQDRVVGPRGASTWPDALSGITAAGPLSITGPGVFSDNTNNDGQANPGENVRYGITITNGTSFPLKLSVTQDNDPHTTVAWPTLSPSASSGLTYNPANVQGYLSVDIPGSPDQSLYRAGFWVTDENGN